MFNKPQFQNVKGNHLFPYEENVMADISLIPMEEKGSR